MNILVLGGISCDHIWLEVDWVRALRRAGHHVVALLPGREQLADTYGIHVSSAGTAAWIHHALRLARALRPDTVVAFNPMNLLVALAARESGWVGKVHFHVHELFTGSLIASPFELSQRFTARRADTVSVPQQERADIVYVTNRLADRPVVIPNYRLLAPAQPVSNAAASKTAVVIPDSGRWLSEHDIETVAAAATDWGWTVTITGRTGPRCVGKVPMAEYVKLCETAAIAVTLSRPTCPNLRYAAPYRAGWFLALGVPQAISAGSYADPFVRSGAAVAVSPLAVGDEIVTAIDAIRLRLPTMADACAQAHASWGNLEAHLNALPWLAAGT